jgi:hypothetical protein
LETKATTSAAAAAASPVSKLSKFAWADETSRVKVYVTLADNGIQGTVDAAVTSTRTSFDLKITAVETGKVYALEIAALSEAIQGATAKVLKGGKVLVTLSKVEGAHFTWYDLKKKP